MFHFEIAHCFPDVLGKCELLDDLGPRFMYFTVMWLLGHHMEQFFFTKSPYFVKTSLVLYVLGTQTHGQSQLNSSKHVENDTRGPYQRSTKQPYISLSNTNPLSY